MAFTSSCLIPPQMPFKVDSSSRLCSPRRNQSSILASGTMNRGLFGQQSVGTGAELSGDRGFLGRRRRTTSVVIRPNLERPAECRRSRVVCVSCLPSSEVAASAFTLGTVSVLPFYTIMVVAPKAQFTKKLMSSSIPYILLGLLYAYLLFLSWTPDTLRLLFSSKNWMPELPGIVKLFSSEMAVASAWIHLLVIDLFAARQVFHDGLQQNIETRHSVPLCLLFGPLGVITHFTTKALTEKTRRKIH